MSRFKKDTSSANDANESDFVDEVINDTSAQNAVNDDSVAQEDVKIEEQEQVQKGGQSGADSQDPVAVLLAQVNDLTEALQRERADVTNVRRRHEEQLAGLKTTLKVGIVEELLPAIDNLERALKHTPEDLKGNPYIKGVEGVAKQFDQIFSSLSIEKIATVGADFDPHIHEAVSADEGEGDKEIVSEELQSGYKLGDTVIRPAMVKVTRK